MNNKTSKWMMVSVASAFLLTGTGTLIPAAGYAAEAVTAVPISVQLPQTAGAVTVAAKEVNSDTALLKVVVKIPVLSGMKDTKYQDQLNDLIESHAMKDLSNAEDNAKSTADIMKQAGFEPHQGELNISYELKSDGSEQAGGIVSLRVVTYAYTGGANGSTRADTYNVVNAGEAKLAKLADLLGDNYKATIDAAVNAGIAKNPENFFKENGFNGIDETQSFYVENGDVVVEFPKYSIAPGSSGLPSFHVPIGAGETAPSTPATAPSRTEWTLQVNGESLKPEEGKLVIGDDGQKLIPLRAVTEKLGYSLTWKEDTSSAELAKGAQWTSVTLGQDRYTFARMAPFSLGAAPVILDSRMYVPLAFAEQALKAAVTTTDEGVIDISQNEQQPQATSGQ